MVCRRRSRYLVHAFMPESPLPIRMQGSERDERAYPVLYPSVSTNQVSWVLGRSMSQNWGRQAAPSTSSEA